ncbi:uncharacterized protein [Haliotis asinina]|uniref:uncharacterized protein n=1 Tax=Haliotis asinina TaxID=109174 RepID=UPI003531E80F
MGAVELWLITCVLVGVHCSSNDECRDGFYGVSCEERCPSKCLDNLCHRFNVSCKKGCIEGWHGKKCDEQCSGCPGPCHRWSGECTGKSSEKTDLSSIDHQSKTYEPTNEITHSAMTTDATRSECRERECWIEFNGWTVCCYECTDGARGTVCAKTSPRNSSQNERHVTSFKLNVSRLDGEDCNEIGLGFTVRCFNESNVDESLKIQYVEACSQNCSMYCRNLSVNDTLQCDLLLTACVDECIREHLCDDICGQGKESEQDTTPNRGGRPKMTIITIVVTITITITIVITASCVFLSVRCCPGKTQNRPPASSPYQLSARDVDDIVNTANDREGDAGDGLREIGDMGAPLPLSEGYLSAVHRDTEEGGYALPNNLWTISSKHQASPNSSYISPVHSSVYAEMADDRSRRVDHRRLFGDYQPRAVSDSQTCDLSERGAGYSNPYGAHNSTWNAQNPPQEHYQSLNRLQHIDPNRLYSVLEISDEEAII